MNRTGTAREEAVKREVNEAIEAGLWPGEQASCVRMRCECGSPECIAFVTIRVSEYESIRQHARRFVIAAGHQETAIEQVVARTPQYAVVEKIGPAGEVAEQSDPRAGPVGDGATG